MNILALDIATLCGWATAKIVPTTIGDARYRIVEADCGTITLLHKRELASHAERRITQLIDDHAPDGVFIESPFTRGKGTRKLDAFNRIAAWVCENRRIPVSEYAPMQVKKYATGNGNATKQQMLEWAEERFPALRIEDDNAADALALLATGVGRMK